MAGLSASYTMYRYVCCISIFTVHAINVSGSRGDVPQPEPEGGPAAPAAHQPEAAAAGQPPGAAPTQVAWPGDISLYYQFILPIYRTGRA